MIPCEPTSEGKPTSTSPIMADYNMTFTAYSWIFEEFYKILPYNHNAQCMEDIMTSTGGIDAMAEEIIKPTIEYERAESPPQTTAGEGLITGIPTRPDVTETGSDITPEPCGTSCITSEMSGGEGENGNIQLDTDVGSGIISSGFSIEVATDKPIRKPPPTPPQQSKVDDCNVGFGDSGDITHSGVRSRIQVDIHITEPSPSPFQHQNVEDYDSGGSSRSGASGTTNSGASSSPQSGTTTDKPLGKPPSSPSYQGKVDVNVGYDISGKVSTIDSDGRTKNVNNSLSATGKPIRKPPPSPPQPRKVEGGNIRIDFSGRSGIVNSGGSSGISNSDVKSGIASDKPFRKPPPLPPQEAKVNDSDVGINLHGNSGLVINNVNKGVANDKPIKNPPQPQKDVESKTTDGIAGVKAKIGPPPKLPPKPAGLLEKVKEGMNAPTVKPKPAVLPKGNALRKITKTPGCEANSASSITGGSISGDLTDGGKSSAVLSRLESEAKPPLPAARIPVAMTRSLAGPLHAKHLHDGIQRTCSSPLAAQNNTATVNSAIDSQTKHSTEAPQKPPHVHSRVHNIHDNLRHTSAEIPRQNKKLSVRDHNIKVKERAAVFEKIVQGISEETSIVSLDIDVGGGRKRSARKPDLPVSPNAIITSGSGMSLMENEVSEMTVKGVLSKSESVPVTSASLPIPRPRNTVSPVKGSNESIQNVIHRPTPQPRISIAQNPEHFATTETSNFETRNPNDIYDEVREFAHGETVTASLAQGVTERDPSMIKPSDDYVLAENLYEDTLLPDTYMESIPRLPPEPSSPISPGPAPAPTPISNTCHNQLTPILPKGGPHVRSSAAEETIVADESASRERGSIYEVCFSEDTTANDQSDDGTVAVADTTRTEDKATLQEMPAHRVPGDLITTSKDEEEDGGPGTHKISRQRRQQRVAVKMRSAEGSGLVQRRNGELKRQGRSLQDLDRGREEVNAKKEEQEVEMEEEEQAEKRGSYNVTQPEAVDNHYIRLYGDQGSDGNEYEEVPSLSSSDEEPEKRETSVTLDAGSMVDPPQEDGDDEMNEGPYDLQDAPEAEYVELEEERRESVDVFPVAGIRDRAKTSPESVRAAGREKMRKKRHSEGAFEDFVPLFFKREADAENETKESVPRSKSQGAISDAMSDSDRPKSVGAAVMEDIRLIRAEIDRRNARRLNDEKEEMAQMAQSQADAASEDSDSYQYVSEVNFDNENMSSDDSSDYEQVTGESSTKHGHSSGVCYDLEEHRRTLSREGSHKSAGSSGTGDYLVLFEDWKEVEESSLIMRRNKGSNEKKERRRVIPMDSSASASTQSTTQGSLDIPDLSDSQTSDENVISRSNDGPASPGAAPNSHRMAKQGGISLPGLEVTASKVSPPDEAPPPIPGRKKSTEKPNLPLSLGGFSRKPSRFVAKEPLFQIYQADLRVRDSNVILRPRTARRSKNPPLPARSYLTNRNLPPPLPPHHPQVSPPPHPPLNPPPPMLGSKPSLPAGPPPPLPARNNSNISSISNMSNITNRSVSSTNSSNTSQDALSSEIRVSLQKELFTKLNTSSESSKIENFAPLNNNIRSGDSHKIMDNSRTCSGNSVNANDAMQNSQPDEMEEPTYMSGNDEGSSSMYSCEEESLGEMDRNRTHGSSMETRSSQQSTEGGIDEDPIYQGGLGDPTYQPGMGDGTYQPGMEEPTYGGGQHEDDDGYDEFDDDFDDDDYYTPPPRDGPVREGSVVLRSYWCELPEVVTSGLLQNLTAEEKKMQEALFEIITSEASYLRSLNLVVNHFVEAPGLMPPHGVLKRPEHHSLFSNIKTVRDTSERLLLELEQHQRESILLSDVCRILHNHLKDQRFEQGFVTYCANNQYQVKMLHQFKNNVAVMHEIRELEASPECCNLDLLSFLMLPFQRITRLPLLLEAVISRAPEGSELMTYAVDAFTAVRKMAEKCNEEAKRMEMIEEVTILARMLDFKPGVKKMDISQSSTIVKRGMLDTIVSQANILGGKKKPTTKRIYCIVFTDKVLLAKEKTKGDQTRFDVIDWCPRNLVQVNVVDQPNFSSKLADGVPPDCHCIFTLNLLQNNQRKTNEFILNAKSLSERQRWMDALVPPTQTEDGERIYESWDCPQVICVTNHEANDRDELSLELSDRVDVYKKIDGWYEGQLVGSRERGWFPASCVEEVVNDHVRARILKKRHKILSMCEEQIRLGLGPKLK